MEKILTVTVPCYNSAEYMHKCLDTLVQGGERMDVIIINDGSSDDTGKIADSYAEKYPDIIRVVYQENGGHGEGINQGVRHAKGKYFKVVDSDDWVNVEALGKVLDFLTHNEVDLLIANYVYEYTDGTKPRVVRYNKVFTQQGVITDWQSTRRFAINEYITLHSATYRTQILHDCGTDLPKHTFYEDNLFVYKPLPLAKRIAYLDVDFYRYLIGREGQSVNKEVMKKRCSHQVLVTKEILVAHDLDKIKEHSPKLARYMYHKAVLVGAIATVYTRMNKTSEAEKMNRDMWDYIIERNPSLGKRVRYRSTVFFLNLPGKLGNSISCGLYELSRKVFKFN